MPIAKELADFADEDDFVKRFLVPLFRRMGFEIVANYHGKREFGKDLLIGEVDRFSHVRYHGVQAKFESSIGKEAMHSLIQQCDEAFVKPFTHPQTGQIQKISSFYAVTAGSVSDEARELFFDSLQPKHADNVRILEGKDLLALDRFVVISRSENVRDLLDGLLHECRFGLRVLEHVVPELERIAHGNGNGVKYPLPRLRVNAVSAFLIRPVLFEDIPLKVAEAFWSRGTAFNQTLDQAGASPLHTVVSIKQPAIAALKLVAGLQQDMQAIADGVERSMARLGALAG
jgi:hypothetical protein